LEEWIDNFYSVKRENLKEVETEKKTSQPLSVKKEENLMESIIDENPQKYNSNCYNRLQSTNIEDEINDSENSFMEANKNSLMNNSDISASNKVNKKQKN
jgi:hypothetical protein